MMTVLLYQTDSYVQTFDASVIEVDEANHGVILDRTAFYPGGGGQPADRGTLTFGPHVYTVAQARKIGAQLVHIVPEGEPRPAIGTSVQGQIDWERRYQLMRTHTAMHILCGVVFRDYGALVTGGDMDPLKGRMDFEFETMQKELVTAIEAAVNEAAAKGLPVQVRILPREEAFQIPDLIRTKINLLPEGIEEVRVVEIVGLDMQADGGTHVRNTSEVGRIRVTDYKSKVYIELEG
jgi:misacylated tRNA(Ala) deacylase